MNVYLLPVEQHVQTLAELEARARAAACACGAEKVPQSPFCGPCKVLLIQSGCGFSVQHLAGTMTRSYPWLTFDWQLYDQLTDVLQALHTGRWDGKRNKKEQAD